MKKTLALIMCLVALVSITQAKELSLESAKEILLEKNLDYKVSLAQIEQAKSNKLSSLFSFLPTANVTASHSRFDEDQQMIGGYSTQYGLSISQTILAGGSKYYNNKIQNESYLMQLENKRQTIIDLTVELESLYYDALEATKYLSIAERSLKISQKHLSTGQVKFKQGLISKEDMLRLELDVNNKKLALIDQDSKSVQAYKNLKDHLNIEEDFELVDITEDSFDEPLEEISSLNDISKNSIFNNLWTYAERNNSQLRQNHHSLQISNFSLNMKKMSFLPTLNLAYNKSWSATEASSSFDDSGTLSLTASLAIFPLANKYHDMNAQRESLNESTLNRQILSDNLQTSLLTILNSYYASVARLTVAEKSYELNTALFDKFEAKLWNNTFSVEDMLDIEIDLANAHETYVSSKYTYLKMKSSLKQLLGIDSDQEFNRILKAEIKGE